MKNADQLDILYLDDHFVVVYKPAGLLVLRSRVDPGEKNFALLKVRDQIGQHVFPVHRLDRPTSGILLFALNPETGKDVFISATPDTAFLLILNHFGWKI